MIKVGLTGGIGSGKTTVARIFSVLGIPVFSADSEGKRIMESDVMLAAAIRTHFGDEMYDEQGRLDRAGLAAVVFQHDEKLQLLNSLVHPAVIRASDDWAEQQKSPYVIKESALLFETDAWKHCDIRLLISAPEEVRISRVMERDQVSREKVLRRMKYQLPDSTKIKMADKVILNDDKSLLIPQVLSFHEAMI